MKLGDHVRIILTLKNSYGDHFGQTGKIVEKNLPSRVPYVVQWDKRSELRLYYSEEDLEILGPFHMEPPEMELDEIERGIEIMESLK